MPLDYSKGPNFVLIRQTSSDLPSNDEAPGFCVVEEAGESPQASYFQHIGGIIRPSYDNWIAQVTTRVVDSMQKVFHEVSTNTKYWICVCLRLSLTRRKAFATCSNVIAFKNPLTRWVLGFFMVIP